MVDVYDIVPLYRYSSLLQVGQRQIPSAVLAGQEAFFQAARINNNQPIRKATPPKGVIIPSALTPERTMTYNEPEKRRIPTWMAHPALRAKAGSGIK
jgi:hypothetical protein